jgi:nucleotide-binding universal stress UspA family protein
MKTFANILVPIDFGEPSERALELAVELAKQNGGEVIILHVFDVPASYAGMGISPIDLLAPMWAAGRKQLEDTLEKVKTTIPGATEEIARGAPWREILAAIERHRPDLVVMGTHGRRGVPRAVLGSVAEKIVRLSPVPVLTVRARDDA